MPAHLPRERTVHEPAPTCTACGGTVLRKLGEDVTELLEYIPSSFKVVQIVRPKWSCRACETIAQAPLPSVPIERRPAWSGNEELHGLLERRRGRQSLDDAKAAFQAAGERRRPRFSRQWAVCGE